MGQQVATRIYPEPDNYSYAGNNLLKRRRAVAVLASLLGVLLFIPFSGARADYAMPPFHTVVAEATAIVDATVVEHRQGGDVRIEVHAVLKGTEPAAVLSKVWIACLEGVDLSRMLKLGQRYVLVLRDASLYASVTIYEVRDSESGSECNCWDGSTELRRHWMQISEFKQLVEESTRTP